MQDITADMLYSCLLVTVLSVKYHEIIIFFLSFTVFSIIAPCGHELELQQALINKKPGKAWTLGNPDCDCVVFILPKTSGTDKF